MNFSEWSDKKRRRGTGTAGAPLPIAEEPQAQPIAPRRSFEDWSNQKSHSAPRPARANVRWNPPVPSAAPPTSRPPAPVQNTQTPEKPAQVYPEFRPAPKYGDIHPGDEYEKYTDAADFDELSKYKKRGHLTIGGDGKYNYINDVGTTRDNIGEMFKGPEPDGGYGYYRTMLPDEVKVYNYLYEKEGKENAEKYLSHLMPKLKERYPAYRENELQKEALAHPVIESAKSVPRNLAGGVEGSADLLFQNAHRAITGRPVDYNSPAQMKAKEASTTRAAISEDLEKKHPASVGGVNVASMLYNTGMSAADSLVAAFIPGKIAAGTVLASGAASSAAQDIHARGGSDNQALVGALAAGTFEQLFESISIGNLKSMKEVPIKKVKDVFKNIAKSTGVNASEEGFTEIANILFDTLALYDVSNYKQAVENYKKTMPEAEAKKAAIKDLAVQVAESAVSGGLMGLGFGGIGSGTGAVNAYAKNKAMQEVREVETRRIRRTVSDIDYIERQLAAQGVSDTEAKKVIPAISAVMTGEQISGSQAAEIAKSPAALAYIEAVTGAEIDRNKPLSELKQDIRNGFTPTTYATFAQEAEAKNESKRKALPDDLQKGADSFGTSGKAAFAANYNGENSADYFGGFSAFYNAGVNGAEPSTVPEQWAASVSPDAARAAFAAGRRDARRKQAQVSAFGEVGTKALKENAGADGYAFARAYNDGLAGKSRGVSYSETISNGVYDAAYEAGKADAAAALRRDKEAAGNAKKSETAGLERDAWAVENVADQTAERIDKVARALGLRVRFLDQVEGGDANAQISGTTVEIERGNKHPIAFLFGHEITHRMQELSPSEYRAFREIALSMIDNLNERIEILKEAYAEKGRAISNDAILDELTADFAGKLINNGELLDRFIARHKGKRSLLQWLKDIIHTIADKVSGKDGTALRAAEKKLEKALEASAKRAEGLAIGTDNNVGSAGRASLKDEQYEEIQKANPAPDDTHTWIRNVDDIMTFEEAMEYDGLEPGEDDVTPDYTAEMVRKAVETGTITVYSSYPIENGIFVTPSKMEARNYAGGGKVYSKTARLSDIAWIDSIQGQYAKVAETKKQKLSLKDIQDAEYVEAVETENYVLANRMVSSAALESGAISDGKKPLKLYHGTDNFGFTKFNGDAIFTTADPSIAAGYTKNKGYGRKRHISQMYKKDDGEVNTLITNAKNVLGLSLREISDSDVESAKKDIAEKAKTLSERIDNVWTGDAVDFLFEIGMADNLQNDLSVILSLAQTVDSDLEYETIDDERTREGLINDAEQFEGRKRRVYDFFVDHYNEIENSPAKGLDSIIRGSFELGDFAIELQSFLHLYDRENYLISANGSPASIDNIREYVERTKNIGSYEMYGFLGDRPLVIETNGAHWTNVSVPGWEGTLTTDGVVKKARDSGYTSVVFKDIYDMSMNDYAVNKKSDVYVFFDASQLKSADTVTYDDGGNVIPLSKRFNFSDPDIRFSLKRSAEEKELADLRAKTNQMREQLTYWRGQVKQSKGTTINRKAVEKTARELISMYDSNTSKAETAAQLQKLYDYLASGKDGAELSFDEAQAMAQAIAEDIIESAVRKDDELYNQYADLRKYAREHKFQISEADKGDIPDFDSDFRRPLFGKLNIVNGKSNIDSLYQEMSAMWPEFFDEAEQTAASDQLQRIAEVLDAIYTVEDYNPFSEYQEQAIEELSDDILARFTELPETRPTFADYRARELQKAKDRITALNKKVAETRTKEKGKGREKLFAERAKAKAKYAALKEAYEADIKALKTENEKEVTAALMNQGKKDAVSLRKAQEQVRKIRAERDAKLAEAKEDKRERVAGIREAQKRREMVKRIEKHTSGLRKKLETPTDKNHIPKGFKDAVIQLLEAINLESAYTVDPETGKRLKDGTGDLTKRSEKFRALREKYEQARVGSDEMDYPEGMSTDPDLEAKLDELSKLRDVPIRAMNLEQLTMLYETVRAVEKSITEANRLFAEGKAKEIEEVVDLVFDAAETLKRREADNPVSNLLQIDMLTTYSLLHKLGDGGDIIYGVLRDAENKKTVITKEMSDATHEVVSLSDIKRLSEPFEFDFYGRKIKTTKAHLMAAYETIKRQAAERHLDRGGIRFGDFKDRKGRNHKGDTTPLRENKNDLMGAIENALTPEELRLADRIQNLITKMSGYINETTMQVYGYEKATEDDYFPMKSDDNQTVTDLGDMTGESTVAGMGSMKALNKKASNTLIIDSIFDIYAKYVSDMTIYASFLPALEDVRRIYNAAKWEKSTDTATGKTIYTRGMTVKRAFEDVFGNAGKKYFQNLIADLNRGNAHSEQILTSGLAGAYKASTIGANFRVFIQQLTSIPRAFAEIDPKYFAKSANKKVIGKGSGWEKALKYAPIAQWKDWGYFDIATGRTMRNVLYGDEKTLDKIKGVAMSPAGFMDSIGWGMIWNAVEAETKEKHPDVKPDSTEFIDICKERFDDVVRRTQVVDSVLQRSGIMRSKDGKVKEATSFMGEPTQTYNIIYRAIDGLQNAPEGQKKEKLRELSQTAAAITVSLVMNAAAQAIIDAERDDDKKKKYLEKLLAEFGKNLAESANPLGYIPFFRDVVSIIQGYDVNRMDMQPIARLVSALKIAAKALQGEGRYTMQDALIRLFAELAHIKGVPVGNAKREITSAVKTLLIESDNYKGQYYFDKQIYSLHGYTSNFLDILYQAKKNDRIAYLDIRNDMERNGIDPKKIDAGLKRRAKEE